jgi:hypothetical protein
VKLDVRKWDIWSLSMILYFMWMRRHPLSELDATSLHLIFEIVNGRRPDFVTSTSGSGPAAIPPPPVALRELVVSMWRSDPKARPAIEDVLAALEALALKEGGITLTGTGDVADIEWDKDRDSIHTLATSNTNVPAPPQPPQPPPPPDRGSRRGKRGGSSGSITSTRRSVLSSMGQGAQRQPQPESQQEEGGGAVRNPLTTEL